MEKIRILHILGSLRIGGAENMVMNLYRNIDRKRIQFDFIIHSDENDYFREEILSLGGRVYKIPRYNGLNHFVYKKAWNRFFEEHREYRIIHGHVRSTASIYLGIARKYGLITISHSHNTSSGRGLSSLAKDFFQSSIDKRADYLFACSAAAGVWLYGNDVIYKDNYHLFKNSIDANKFVFNNEVRKRKRDEMNFGDKKVIGHVGRFVSQKNHDFLIRVFSKISEKDENTLLCLVGDGELEDQVRSDVMEAGLSDKVVFAGVRKDVNELMQAFDIFLFPSLFEGLPLTLVEAQAASLKCMVSDVITEEIEITDLIYRCSLANGADYWAERLLDIKTGEERCNRYEDIRKSGYDIYDNAKWISDFYIGLLCLEGGAEC